MWLAFIKALFELKKYFMRAGPQLGVDAFSISNYGSAMFAQVQPQHSPLMLLTPMASAASLGYAGLRAARRNTRFTRYCEGIALADAFASCR